jgi:hypothetical protein
MTPCSLQRMPALLPTDRGLFRRTFGRSFEQGDGNASSSKYTLQLANSTKTSSRGAKWQRSIIHPHGEKRRRLGSRYVLNRRPMTRMGTERAAHHSNFQSDWRRPLKINDACWMKRCKEAGQLTGLVGGKKTKWAVQLLAPGVFVKRLACHTIPAKQQPSFVPSQRSGS